MKVLKVFLALIISVVMIATAAVALGSFAVVKATDEDTIKTAIEESGVVDDLMNEILERHTDGLGGLMGSAAKAIAQTDPMEEFLANYMASAIKAQVYGTETEDISSDELMEAFSAGMEEAVEEKGYNISDTESQMLRAALEQAAPMLTATLNENLHMYESTALDEHTQDMLEVLRLLANPTVKFGTLILTLICALLLILLFWRSRLGFLWAAIDVLLATCAFAVAALVSGSFGQQDSMFIDSAERMVYIMCYNGAVFSAIAGAATGVALIIICAITRGLRRSV